MLCWLALRWMLNAVVPPVLAMVCCSLMPWGKAQPLYCQQAVVLSQALCMYIHGRTVAALEGWCGSADQLAGPGRLSVAAGPP